MKRRKPPSFAADSSMLRKSFLMLGMRDPLQPIAWVETGLHGKDHDVGSAFDDEVSNLMFSLL